MTLRATSAGALPTLEVIVAPAATPERVRVGVVSTLTSDYAYRRQASPLAVAVWRTAETASLIPVLPVFPGADHAPSPVVASPRRVVGSLEIVRRAEDTQDEADSRNRGGALAERRAAH